LLDLLTIKTDIMAHASIPEKQKLTENVERAGLQKEPGKAVAIGEKTQFDIDFENGFTLEEVRTELKAHVKKVWEEWKK